MIYKIKPDQKVIGAIQGLSRYDVSINGANSDFKALVCHLAAAACDGARQLCADVKNDNPEFDRGYIKGILEVTRFLEESSKRHHEK